MCPDANGLIAPFCSPIGVVPFHLGQDVFFWKMLSCEQLSTGGDSSQVQDQLHDVIAIQAAEFAFAAILSNGSVVSWGFSHQDDHD